MRACVAGGNNRGIEIVDLAFGLVLLLSLVLVMLLLFEVLGVMVVEVGERRMGRPAREA